MENDGCFTAFTPMVQSSLIIFLPVLAHPPVYGWASASGSCPTIGHIGFRWVSSYYFNIPHYLSTLASKKANTEIPTLNIIYSTLIFILNLINDIANVDQSLITEKHNRPIGTFWRWKLENRIFLSTNYTKAKFDLNNRKFEIEKNRFDSKKAFLHSVH